MTRLAMCTSICIIFADLLMVDGSLERKASQIKVSAADCSQATLEQPPYLTNSQPILGVEDLSELQDLETSVMSKATKITTFKKIIAGKFAEQISIFSQRPIRTSSNDTHVRMTRVSRSRMVSNLICLRKQYRIADTAFDGLYGGDCIEELAVLDEEGKRKYIVYPEKVALDQPKVIKCDLKSPRIFCLDEEDFGSSDACIVQIPETRVVSKQDVIQNNKCDWKNNSSCLFKVIP